MIRTAWKAIVVVQMLGVFTAAAVTLGSAWHPDADGDQVPVTVDVCPGAYDPLQTDSDSDGVGDACSQPSPILGGAITDLTIEHVTPYGAWVSFTSPHDDQWGWTATVVWSTDSAELITAAGFGAAYARGDKVEILTEARPETGPQRPFSTTTNAISPTEVPALRTPTSTPAPCVRGSFTVSRCAAPRASTPGWPTVAARYWTRGSGCGKASSW
jgi:hypothetical protein